VSAGLASVVRQVEADLPLTCMAEVEHAVDRALDNDNVQDLQQTMLNGVHIHNEASDKMAHDTQELLPRMVHISDVADAPYIWLLTVCKARRMYKDLTFLENDTFNCTDAPKMVSPNSTSSCGYAPLISDSSFSVSRYSAMATCLSYQSP
jgi:hypothetical protein